MNDGALVAADRMEALFASVNAMTSQNVYVGITQAKADRKESGPMNNATIGYIAEHGSPAANIPARPWLVPGVSAAQPEIVECLHKAGIAAFSSDKSGVDKQLGRAGMVAQNKVRAYINSGISPVLADSTLKARARRGRKGAAWELAWRQAGAPPGVELAKPLVDTGEFRNSVTYVVRK